MHQADEIHADPDTLQPPPRGALFGIGVLAGFFAVLGLLFLVLVSREASHRPDTMMPMMPAASESAPAADEGAANLDVDGATIAQNVGCLACHSIDGSERVGPTWAGLFGSTAPDGRTIDEAYLRESIVDPNASVASGFNSGIMPSNYTSTLSDAEIDGLVTYIAGLP